MLKKIIIFISIGILAFASDKIDYNQLVKPLGNNNIESLVKIQQKDMNLDEFYQSLVFQTKLLDNSNILSPYLSEQKKTYDEHNSNQSEFKSFTIFYFISEDTSPDLIKSFSYDIQKLKSIDKNIDALLLSRGLIGGTFDSMAKYVQNLQNLGITNIDITFHPWAFEYFNLERVPAYALSYCKKDFRFKTCEHKFIAKGEISLTNFFEIVSDEKYEYKKYFQKLIEAK